MDYQDFRFRFETGGPKFSTTTEIPIRVLDPVTNANTAGLGDMTVTTRAVLLDGEDWQITQVFNSYFNTGSKTHGTGTGHVSLEPGMLVRWEYSDFTHLHGEIKYLFPLTTVFTLIIVFEIFLKTRLPLVLMAYIVSQAVVVALDWLFWLPNLEFFVFPMLGTFLFALAAAMRSGR